MSGQRNNEEERWRESERRRQIAESLRDILTALNSDQTLEKILDLIAAQARQLLETQAVGIYRLESDVDGWTVDAARGLLVTYVAGFNVPILEPEMQVALYRIAQEALNNMAKYARASQAWVGLRCGAASGQLEVADDGCGFDVEAATAAPERLGLGIMHERAEAIGAHFAVESLPGQGTWVCVRWQ